MLDEQGLTSRLARRLHQRCIIGREYEYTRRSGEVWVYFSADVRSALPADGEVQVLLFHQHSTVLQWSALPADGEVQVFLCYQRSTVL